jgi:glycosyltransferase involved in cell wall biosynthesis
VIPSVALEQRSSDSVVARKRIVIVDMAVAPDSPAGSCVLAEVEGLAAKFDVTVFSERFEPQSRAGIEFVRVRAPRRPIFFRYLAFHLSVPLHYALWRLRGGRAMIVQTTQGQLPGAEVCYAHFCHSAYLKNQWHKSSVSGFRRLARFATHTLNARYEATAMRRAKLIIVPSRGLAQELEKEYPAWATKVRIIPNPVATEHFRRPQEFNRKERRQEHGFADDQSVLAFMALGDFARKGLGLLLQALADLPKPQLAVLRVLVIGGQAGEVAEFSALANQLQISHAVLFVGMQSDVRPFLWVSDVFVLPSAYEVFPLAVVQASAAGLPALICNGVHGVEEFVVDGENGWSIDRKQDAIVAWFGRLIAERALLPRMAAAAVESVRQYDRQAFQSRWLQLMETVTEVD